MSAESVAIYALAFVLTYAIHSTLLLGGACLFAARAAGKSLRLRERMWKVALFGGVVTAAVQVAVGWHTPLAHWTIDDRPATVVAQAPDAPSTPDENARVAALEQRRADLVRELERAQQGEPRLIENAAGPSTPEAANSPEVEVLFARLQALDAQTVEPDAPAADGDHDSPPPVSVASVAPSSNAAAPSSNVAHWRDFEWRAWLAGGLAAWATFALLVVALFAWMWLRLARRLRGRHELVTGDLRALLDGLSARAFPESRVRLFVAPELRTPVSFGWLRRTICVPPRALSELTRDEQETMLAHELAHLARRDPLWLSIAWLTERVFFFQPLNRIARSELHDLAELLCDDWAAVRTGNRVALASCLARIANWIVGTDRALPATSMADGRGRSRLGQRIERLLDERVARRETETTRRGFVPLATLLLSSAVLVVPGVAAATFEVATDMPDDGADDAGGPTGEAEEMSCDSPELGAPQQEESAATGAQAAPESAADAAISPASAPATAPQPALSLESDLAALDEAVVALEHEIAGLRGELGDLHLDDELGDAIDDLVARAGRLTRHRARLQVLIDQTLPRPPGFVLGAASGAPLELNVR